MKTLAPIGSRAAALCALALPTAVLAQPSSRGGVASAWPLGLIVLLVALVAVLGMLLSRRGRTTGGPPPHRP